MIPVFEELPSFKTNMARLSARGRDEGYDGTRVTTSILVHDRASDRAFVSYRFMWDPLMEVACATVESEPEHRRFRRHLSEPFVALCDSPAVRWVPEPSPGVRVGILAIGDEKEISGLYRTLGDLAPYYAWVGKPALLEILADGMRASKGLRHAIKALA